MHLIRTLLLIALVTVPLSAARADYQSARAWFQSLPLEDRYLIQFSLTFTDDYVALADGVFGRHTYEALLRFQSRNGLPATGVLSAKQREVLLKQTAEIYDAVGFDFVDDSSTGLTIGVPLALLTESSPTSRGTRWSGGNGAADMETVRIPRTERSYADLYERLREENEGRRIAYDTFNGDFFVLSGTINAKHFYSRFVRTPTDTRGFSLAWQPELDQVFSRLSVAVSSSMAIGEDPSSSEPPMGGPFIPADPSAPPTEEATMSTGSGFFVTAAGHIATNAHVIDGCGSIIVVGHGLASLTRVDKTNDLAVVHVQARGSVRPLQIRRDPVRLGEEVVVLGYPLGQLMADSLTVTSGNVNALSGLGGDSRALLTSAQVQPGNSGGPLLDRSGAVVGVVSSRLNDVAMLETYGAVPQNVNFAIKAGLLISFLESADVSPSFADDEATDRSVADVAQLGRNATVQIICRN